MRYRGSDQDIGGGGQAAAGRSEGGMILRGTLCEDVSSPYIKVSEARASRSETTRQ